MTMNSLNDLSSRDMGTSFRQNRFTRSNMHLEMYGGSIKKRNLESPERKWTSMNLSHSETRYSKSGHMMPKPDS